jgi:hypothetical protein
MEPLMHAAEDMFALKSTLPALALALGLIACAAGSSSRFPFEREEEEDDSAKRPPPSSNAETPASPPDETQDQHVFAAAGDPKPAAALPPECSAEAEPNDDAEQPTEFTGCIKGALTTWTDVDNLAITAPGDVTEMIVDNVQPDGVIKYAVMTPQGSQSNFTMSFTEKPPPATITPGQTYVFQLKWDNNGQGKVSDNRTYAIRVGFR